jgi:hypothetical protein
MLGFSSYGSGADLLVRGGSPRDPLFANESKLMRTSKPARAAADLGFELYSVRDELHKDAGTVRAVATVGKSFTILDVGCGGGRSPKSGTRGSAPPSTRKLGKTKWHWAEAPVPHVHRYCAGAGATIGRVTILLVNTLCAMNICEFAFVGVLGSSCTSTR